MAKIPVIKPYLPDISRLDKILADIWGTGILTHNGPVVQRFERSLCSVLGLKHIIAVTNGTVALQMAIKAMGLRGEIITTPFTWVASISAIKWESCTPVFCDIDPNTLNLDVRKIEELITEKTVAIMPVHVFGNPCDIETIDMIAREYNLKVIYDAAHAVGSVVNGESLLSYGDISATSFHATKIINTAEGGACVTNDPDVYEKLNRIRFFGFDSAKEVVEDGFNGKMTEVHAALGILNLDSFQSILNDRKEKHHLYNALLSRSSSLKFQRIVHGTSNYSYFPVMFPTEKITLNVLEALAQHEIYARRYFYPSVNTFIKITPYMPCPVSEDISRRILCLPLYYTLTHNDIDRICAILLNVTK